MSTLLAMWAITFGSLLADTVLHQTALNETVLIEAEPIDRQVKSASGAGATRTEPSKAPAQKPLDQSQPGAGAKRDSSAAKALNPRVLLITTEDNPRCAEELARLRRPGGDFERLRSRGWKIGAGPENHLQVVDREAVPEIVSQLGLSAYPQVACIDHEEIVRSFREGCTTPLDMWTFGWMAKGVDERPAAAILEAARVESTGNYRLRGNHWSIDGDSNPPRETVVSHLRGPNHAAYLSASWQIESWSFEELRSLHDDLHERYGGGISHSSRARSSRSTDSLSAGRKTKGR